MSLWARDADGNVREVSHIRIRTDLLREVSQYYGGRQRGFNYLIEELLRKWIIEQKKQVTTFTWPEGGLD